MSIEQPSGAKSELTCPLCREWFDTKTGLSNHVRGHLKRLGKPCSTSTSKSPVIILKELMRDKKQFQVKLQALEKKCRSRNSLYPFKLSNGLIISTAKVQRFAQGGKRHGHVSSRLAEEKKRTEREKDAMKGSPSSDLIGILKKRKAHEEAKMKTLPQTARKALLVNAVKERDPSAQIPNAVSGKCFASFAHFSLLDNFFFTLFKLWETTCIFKDIHKYIYFSTNVRNLLQ